MKNFFKEKWFVRKRDKRWLWLMVPVAVMIWGCMAGLCGICLHLAASVSDRVIWALLAGIMSLALCGFGYADMKIAFGFTAAGIAAGLLFMAFVFSRQIAYRGIVGLVSGMELTFIFFITGINVQMVIYLMKRRRRYGR